MTIEQQIFTALSPVTSGAVFPLIAPDGQAAPYLTYQNISNVPEMTLTGISAQNTRLQIDCYASTYAGVKSLEAAVDAAMLTSGIVQIPQMRQDLYEDVVKLYRVQMDYSIWY
jgi:hypothetical protein